MRDDIVFTTLCICGPELDTSRTQFKGTLHYFEVCNILIHSVLKYTNGVIVIVTDRPDLFIQHDRVVIKNIYDCTDEPLIKAGYMNFNLKRFALSEAFSLNKKYVVYVDCDVFLEGFDESIFTLLDSIECDVAGRLGISPVEMQLNKKKVQDFGPHWSDDFLQMTLPHETFLIFKQNVPKQKEFINFWSKLAEHIRHIETTTYQESYSISASIMRAKMLSFNFSENMNHPIKAERISSFLRGLRLIHAENVNTIEANFIEEYNYEQLFERVK